MSECEWTYEGSNDVWETACGKAFCIVEGTPQENEIRYCCFCGGKLTHPGGDDE